MNKHSNREVVRHHECDARGGLKLPALLDYLQDAAAEHAALLGFGMTDMARQKLFWVLSRLKIRISASPALGDELELTTYPSGFARVFATRQYDLRRNGERIAVAGSEWLLVHTENGRPANPLKALPGGMPDNSMLECFFPSLDKLSSAEGAPCGTAVVGMGDVDLNCHLNNAVYGRWIVDALGRLRAPCVPLIQEIQINFLHAGLPGDEIALTGLWQENDSFAISGAWANGNPAFQAIGIAESPSIPD